MIVGLTGGIGSGKSTVAKMFSDLGIPIYITDDEAKKMLYEPAVQKKIIELLGHNAFDKGVPDRVYIAQKVFNNKELLEGLNKIIHPEVQLHFNTWYKQQLTPYVIKEAAILFETGGNRQCDFVITVTAPVEVRILRAMKRDHAAREQIESRMKNQWPDEEKIKLSDFTIQNNNIEFTRLQVSEIHEILLKKHARI